MDYQLISGLFNNNDGNPPRPFANAGDFKKFLQFMFIRYPEKLLWLGLKGIESGQLPKEMNDFVSEFKIQMN